LRRPNDASDWRALAIRAASLAGVAPAIVITAECDALHDDGAGYAEALRRAGVPVEYREFPRMIHGFFGMVSAVDNAMNAQRAVWAAFKRPFCLSATGDRSDTPIVLPPSQSINRPPERLIASPVI
jgi:acetyl esterase